MSFRFSARSGNTSTRVFPLVVRQAEVLATWRFALALCIALVLHGSTPATSHAQGTQPDGAQAVSSPTPAHTTPRVGAYVGVDWRAMGLAGHASHGPGVQAGVLLFHGRLKIGIAAFGRPGPMNPETFRLRLEEGTTYRGQEALDLRSDGSFVGLAVTPVFDLSRWAPVVIEVPVAFGQSAFGFYLVGDDRETPDGRLPSAWENELMDERDASFALGLDVGIDVAFVLPRTHWLRPYFGVHRHQTFGFDAFLADDYSGFYGLAGVQLGTF